MRCFMKNLKSKVSGLFFKDSQLLPIWRTLTGALFLPLTNPEILKIVKNYLKDQIKLLNNDKGQKFSEFYSYLNKFYFSENSPFNPGNYDFYNSIIFQGNMTTSTNCLESLNRVLKNFLVQDFCVFLKFAKY